MERKRTELLPGVWLTAVRTADGGRACFSVTLLTQLSRETAAMHAALPYALRHSRAPLADEDSAAIRPTVRKIGEIQAIGLRSVFENDGAARFSTVARQTLAMLLAPGTRGGLLRQDAVQGALAELTALRAQSEHEPLRRLVEEMCCYEDFSVPALGDEAETDSKYYIRLTRCWQALLAASPTELFYCGALAPNAVAGTLRELLAGMPRGALDDTLGTDIRMNSLEAQPREITETADGGERALAIGWRLGEQMEDPDLVALRVFAAYFGETLGARESVRLDMHKGLLAVCAAPSDGEAEEIFSALADIQSGAIDPALLDAAKARETAALQNTATNPEALEQYWLERDLLGVGYDPGELCALIGEVTPEDVRRSAQGLECDVIYHAVPVAADE